MHSVRICATGLADRVQQLDEGPVVFGSEFNCDVVLIDDDIQPEHFYLMIEQTGVTITLQTGAQGQLIAVDGEVTELKAGAAEPWFPNQTLKTSGLEIQLGGTNVVAPQETQSKFFAFSNAMRTPALAAVCVVATIGIAATQVKSKQPKSDQASEVRQMNISFPAVQDLFPSTEPMMEKLPKVVETRPSDEEALAILAKSGFSPLSVVSGAEGQIGTFYLERQTEREALMEVIANERLDLKATVHLKTQLMSAINITLQGIGADARVIEMKDGKVSLTGHFGEPKKRKDIVKTLLRDVRGVRSVDFDSPMASDAEALEKEIAGIWMGQRPYVILKDGRIVRPGEEIVNEISLVKVAANDSIVIRQAGKSEEITLK